MPALFPQTRLRNAYALLFRDLGNSSVVLLRASANSVTTLVNSSECIVELCNMILTLVLKYFWGLIGVKRMHQEWNLCMFVPCVDMCIMDWYRFWKLLKFQIMRFFYRLYSDTKRLSVKLRVDCKSGTMDPRKSVHHSTG